MPYPKVYIMQSSKKILVVVSIVNAVVVAAAIFCIIALQDTSSLSYLVPSVATEFSAAVAFYYKKAAMENKLKIANQLIMDLTEKYGPDFTAQIFTSIINET